MSNRNEMLREQRIEIYQRQGGLCAVCHGPLAFDAFELAHVLPERKWVIAHYGFDVVDSIYNKKATHRGICNSRAQIEPIGLEAEEHAKEVRQKEDK